MVLKINFFSNEEQDVGRRIQISNFKN